MDLIKEYLPIILELLMIICFGLSWPFHIVKAYRARTAKGTSFIFTFFIWLGYIFGIVGKLIIARWFDWLFCFAFAFYVINLIMLTAGLIIFFRNRRLDRLRSKESASALDVSAVD